MIFTHLDSDFLYDTAKTYTSMTLIYYFYFSDLQIIKPVKRNVSLSGL